MGAALIKLMEENGQIMALRAGRPFAVSGISARNKAKDRGFDVNRFRWFEDPLAMLDETKPDVLIELVGGAEGVALKVVMQALQQGISVITANKALLATHGKQLAEIAEATGAQIYFEAAVAGGIPIIKAVKESLAGNQIKKLTGILNGTTNYILTEMAKNNVPLLMALKEAQHQGYAEADPTLDINGMDAAHKLSLLTTLAFGQLGISIYVEGIERVEALDIEYAKHFGFVIKLLSIAEKIENKILQRVHLAIINQSHELAQVNGAMNAIQIEGNEVGKLTFIGAGAGGSATASAVAADLVAAARNMTVPLFGQALSTLKTGQSQSMQERYGSYYVRLNVVHKQNALNDIRKIFSDSGILMTNIVEKNNHDDGKLVVMFTIKPTIEKIFIEAMDNISTHISLIDTPRFIRIETF